MATPHESRDAQLALALAALLQGWLAGSRPPVETILQEYGLAEDPAAVVELVHVEALLREAHGETLTPDDYGGRFPALADAIRLRFARAAGLGGVTLDATAPAGTPGNATAAALPGVPGYEILGELGRGGMGVVYRARQVHAGRVVALKMVLAGVHAGAAELGRFRREAQAIAALQHPGIVQVFEVGEIEQSGVPCPYFSLEYCSGGTLAARLGAPVPAHAAAALVEQLARAVQAAHVKGVVHRDLKPANILLTDDGTPKIADFGLAKLLGGDPDVQTRSGAVLGTPAYMAPEQAAGQAREAGPAVDVYALGAILYACLTGRPPFRGADILDTLRQVIEQRPTPPQELNPAVPRDLETICLKCLDKQPEQRYASAANLADDLSRFLAGAPIQARPASPWHRFRHTLRQRPGFTAGVAVALVFYVPAAALLSGFAPAIDFFTWGMIVAVGAVLSALMLRAGRVAWAAVACAAIAQACLFYGVDQVQRRGPEATDTLTAAILAGLACGLLGVMVLLGAVWRKHGLSEALWWAGSLLLPSACAGLLSDRWHPTAPTPAFLLAQALLVGGLVQVVRWWLQSDSGLIVVGAVVGTVAKAMWSRGLLTYFAWRAGFWGELLNLGELFLFAGLGAVLFGRFGAALSQDGRDAAAGPASRGRAVTRE